MTTNCVPEEGGQDGVSELVAAERHGRSHKLPPHSYTAIISSPKDQLKQGALQRLVDEHSGEKQRLQEEHNGEKQKLVEEINRLKKENDMMSRLFKLEQFQKMFVRELKEVKTLATTESNDDSRSTSSGYSSTPSSL